MNDDRPPKDFPHTGDKVDTDFTHEGYMIIAFALGACSWIIVGGIGWIIWRLL